MGAVLSLGDFPMSICVHTALVYVVNDQKIFCRWTKTLCHEWINYIIGYFLALGKPLARLCSKENFREPFGLPSILTKAPRPKSWLPE